MKNKGIILKGAFVLFIISMAHTGFAQFSIGPKAGYNSFQETAGFGGQIVMVSGKVRTSLDFMKHLQYINSGSELVNPIIIETTTKQQFHELNLNFSYLFKTDKAYFYPIVGMNIASYNKRIIMGNYSKSYPGSYYNDKYTEVYNSAETNSKIGVNLGAGAQYNLGFISPFIEAKYSISDICNGSIGGGILLNFGRGKKQE